MQTIEMKATPTFERNYDAWELYKILVNQGGTRSGKTYGIAQLVDTKALEVTGKIITIARKTTPSLVSSVMRDFFTILKDMGIYDEACHNKTSKEYNLYGNLIEFISMDDAEKKRGSKRDWLWLNEATEFSYEDFFQLSIRTSEKIILDYNPSYEFHWIYDKVLTRKDAILIKSTYLDNPFLEKTLVEEIERLKEVDENYWKVYGLGERGQTKATIYTNWELVDEFPADDQLDDILYGIDFGYNNPSAIVKIGVRDNVKIYIEQILYQSGLTNQALIAEAKNLIPKDHIEKKLFVADSAEPDRIKEFQNEGFYITACKKGKNSVKNGIDLVKRKKLYIVKSGSELIKEIQFYKWKEDKDGKILDEPVAFNDHAMSASRYAIEKTEELGGEIACGLPYDPMRRDR